MKGKLKIIGVIAIIAIIGFLMVACGNGECTHIWNWVLSGTIETKTCSECGITDGTRTINHFSFDGEIIRINFAAFAGDWETVSSILVDEESGYTFGFSSATTLDTSENYFVADIPIDLMAKDIDLSHSNSDEIEISWWSWFFTYIDSEGNEHYFGDNFTTGIMRVDRAGITNSFTFTVSDAKIDNKTFALYYNGTFVNEKGNSLWMEMGD